MSVRNGSQLTGVPWDLRLTGHTSATHTFLVHIFSVPGGCLEEREIRRGSYSSIKSLKNPRDVKVGGPTQTSHRFMILHQINRILPEAWIMQYELQGFLVVVLIILKFLGFAHKSAR